MTTEVDQFLMGGSVRSAKFAAHGDRVSGTITELEVRQQTSFEDNKPLFWDDGKPRTQLVVTLQTAEADEDDDDGLRRVYVKGQMQKAVRDAILKANEKGPKVGGELVVQYTGDEPNSNPRLNASKLYRARYQPPLVQLPDDHDDEDLPFE